MVGFPLLELDDGTVMDEDMVYFIENFLGNGRGPFLVSFCFFLVSGGRHR